MKGTKTVAWLKPPRKLLLPYRQSPNRSRKCIGPDIFEDDQELKEQARLARLKKEEEEREAKLAAKEAEKLRKQKEKEEKERRKREAGPSWIQRKIDSLTKEIFSDDDMKWFMIYELWFMSWLRAIS